MAMEMPAPINIRSVALWSCFSSVGPAAPVGVHGGTTCIMFVGVSAALDIGKPSCDCDREDPQGWQLRGKLISASSTSFLRTGSSHSFVGDDAEDALLRPGPGSCTGSIKRSTSSDDESDARKLTGLPACSRDVISSCSSSFGPRNPTVCRLSF